MGRVGSAFSDYRLGLQGFDQDVDHILQRMQTVQTTVAQMGQGGSGSGSGLAQQSNAWAQLQRAQAAYEAQSGNTAAAQQRLQNVLDSLNATTTQSISVQRQKLSIEAQGASSAQRAASNSLQMASAQAKLAVSSGQLNQAESILVAELQRQTIVTPQVIRTEEQLLKVRQQLARAKPAPSPAPTAPGNAPGGGAALLTTAASALSVLGGVQQLVSFGKEAINAANSLEKTEVTVRALAGSQARYNEVLALAQQGQKLYGGTLDENLAGLGSLVNLSNRTSVSLKQLDNVSRRLAIVDPLQGIEGATVALKEFLTGADATAIQSLVRRFELPKSALRALTDETLTADQKLQALDRVLAEQGITQEVLSNRTQTTAATYDRMSSSLGNAKVAIGGWLAQGLQPAAHGLELLANVVADNITQLNTYQTKLQQVSTTTIAQGGAFDSYAAKVASVNAQLPIWGARLQPLSRAQYDFAQSLIRSGSSAAEAEAKVRSLGNVAGFLEQQLQSVGGPASAVGGVLQSLGPEILQIAASSRESGDAAIELSGAFANNEITAAQFKHALDELITTSTSEANATQNSTMAVAGNNAAMSSRTALMNTLIPAVKGAADVTQESADASLLDTNSKQLQAVQTQALQASTQLAVQSFLQLYPSITASGLASMQAAGQISPLIAQMVLVAIKTRDAANELAYFNAMQGLQRQSTRALIGDESDAAEVMKFRHGVTVDTRNAIVTGARDSAEAEAKYQQQAGNFNPILARRRAELAQLTKGSAAYYNKLSEIDQLEDSATKKGKKKGGAAKVDAAQKVNNQLEDQEIKFNQKMEDAAQQHEKRIADIERHYQEQRLAAEKHFKQQQLDSRADFYESLGDIEDQGLRRVLSEKYEQVEREAADIRAKYGADAAAEYEQAARKVIEDETKLQDTINKLRSNRDAEGKKKSKDQQQADAAQAEYLEGVLKLKQEANAKRLQDIRDQGSTIENEHQQAIDEEQQKYAEAQGQIIESSDRATDKVVLNAERRKVAVDLENTSLAKTQGYYDRIQGKSSGVPTTTPTAPAAQGATTAAPPSSDGQLWAVVDQGVVDILGTTNSILTNGFTALVNGQGEIITRLRDIASAVRSTNSATV